MLGICFPVIARSGPSSGSDAHRVEYQVAPDSGNFS